MALVSCKECGKQISDEAASCPACGKPNAATPTANQKDKTTAGLLAILLGGLGIHKFYLGHSGTGVVYILFCWTFIPAILGFVEGIVYLSSSEERFQRKYVYKGRGK